MKALTTAIFKKIAGSSFTTDIGGRLYKGRAPEMAQYPYAVFMVVANSPDMTMNSSYEDTLIQFSLFSSASGSTEIEDMFGHLKSLYDECTFTITGETLIWMVRENTSMMIEDHTVKNGTVKVWHYAVDYRITTKV